MSRLSGKSVVMIIASNHFRDEELLEPKAILEGAGADVTVASTTTEAVTGMLGAVYRPTMLLDSIEPASYEAIIFVGGSGASEYFHNNTAHKLVQEAERLGKVVAAICIAPSTLANAGLLEGKAATCYSSETGNLKAKGAHYKKQHVVKDGRIITASGPEAAKEFGNILVEALS